MPIRGPGSLPFDSLVAHDDEGFTYNKRVNRLATVQEHYMIVRALERGVSEDRLARTLNIEVRQIKLKRSLLDGVCPEAVEMLKDRSLDASVFRALRKMKPMRQIEAVELMDAMNNFTSRYAQALLGATRQDDLARPEQPKKVRGLTPDQMARMEREMEALQREFKAVEASYGDAVLNLVVASGYLGKLLDNPRISRYLDQHHPEIAVELHAIAAVSSLDEEVRAAAAE
jgi:DNA-binding protein YbaB